MAVAVGMAVGGDGRGHHGHRSLPRHHWVHTQCTQHSSIQHFFKKSQPTQPNFSPINSLSSSKSSLAYNNLRKLNVKFKLNRLHLSLVKERAVWVTSKINANVGMKSVNVIILTVLTTPGRGRRLSISKGFWPSDWPWWFSATATSPNNWAGVVAELAYPTRPGRAKYLTDSATAEQ